MITSIIEKFQRKKQRAVLTKHPLVSVGNGLKLGSSNHFILYPKIEKFTLGKDISFRNYIHVIVQNGASLIIKDNVFFKHWYDELYLAIQQTPKLYIQDIKNTEKNPKDFFQRISNLEYLVAYVACQKILRHTFPSLTLIDCDENAFYCQVKNRWVKEKILIDMAINHRGEISPQLVKLAGKERNYLCQYYDKNMYFPNSLLDF